MRLLPVATEGELAREAADLVAQALRRRPEAALVCATGRTPLGAYAELARRRLDPGRARVFQLDGYLGVADDDPRSLYGWLDRALLAPLGIAPGQVVRLREDTPEPEAECARYEAAAAQAGGWDLAVLGLGPNGHLGFNEPPSPPDAPTRVVTLSPESLRSNRAYFPPAYPVPERAMTAGMRLILGARRILLLVSGERKRAILRRVLDGPPTQWLPASYLATHRDAWIIADRAALGPE